MRLESAINRAKRQRLVVHARQLTPVERLEACVNLAMVGSDIQRAGEALREKLQRERRVKRP